MLGQSHRSQLSHAEMWTLGHTACGNLPEVLYGLSRSVSGACHRQSSQCMGVQVRRCGPAGRRVGDRGSPHWVVSWTFRTGSTRGLRPAGTGAVRAALFLVGHSCRLTFGLCFRFRDINGALDFGTSLRPPRLCCGRSKAAGGVCCRSCCGSCCGSCWVVLLVLALA